MSSSVWLLGLMGVRACACVLMCLYQNSLLKKSRLESEAEATSRLMEQERRQWERSRANVEAVNIRAHDLRHQVRRSARGQADPALLSAISAELDEFDGTYRTGNEALDVALTEKAAMCRARGVTLSVIADGSALEAMEAADLYAFFGNALENALEALDREPVGTAREICVDVRRRGPAAVIHIDNPCSAAVRFSDGAPMTSKPDAANHGFGTRSMRLAVERCGGSLAFSQRDGRFCVDAVLPVPENSTVDPVAGAVLFGVESR